MDLQNIYSILSGIGMVVLGALSVYLKTSTKARTKARQIAEMLGELNAKAVMLKPKKNTRTGQVEKNSTLLFLNCMI